MLLLKMKQFKYTDESPIRLDKFLATKLELSRDNIKRNILNGNILVNGKPTKQSYNLLANDLIEITNLEIKDQDITISDDAISLDVIYEDDNYLAINKPRNVITYNAIGHSEEASVASSLKKMYDQLANNDSIKPGIVHRLDYETSGVLIICKNDLAYQKISQLFKERKITKYYLAICKGQFKNPKGKIEISLSKKFGKKIKMIADPYGKEAITEYEVIAEKEGASLVKVKLITGRTHQIRVHMSLIGHPLLGDTLYGGGNKTNTFYLHATEVLFKDPITNKEIKIEAELPDEYKKKLVGFYYY